MDDITSIIPLEKSEQETLEILKNNGMNFKGTSKAFSTFLVLWLLSKRDMHGYLIMKEIDKFFQPQIEHGIMKSTKANKIYPLLKTMKENNLIESYDGIHKKKNVKIYKLKENGFHLLKLIKKDYKQTIQSAAWKELIADLNIEIKE